MLLRRHLRFRTLANEASSRELEAYATAQTRRRGAALKHRRTAAVLRSACVGGGASFWSGAARAGSEALARGRSTKRLHVETRIWPASDSIRMENDTFLGGRSSGHFSNKKRVKPGSRSIRKSNEPNQAVELTPTLVTSCACAHLAPSVGVAHLYVRHTGKFRTHGKRSPRRSLAKGRRFRIISARFLQRGDEVVRVRSA